MDVCVRVGISYKLCNNWCELFTNTTHIECWAAVRMLSLAPPTSRRCFRLCSRSRPFPINISWTFWWMSTWYILLGCRYANLAVIRARQRENIWIKGGGGGGGDGSQWKSYIFIRICPLAHKSIPKCCKPIQFTIVFLTAVAFLFDLSMPNASNGFCNIVNNCISAASSSFFLFYSWLFLVLRYKNQK